MTTTPALTGQQVYEQHGWSGCDGSHWRNLPPATRDGWDFAARILADRAASTGQDDGLRESLHHLATATFSDFSAIYARADETQRTILREVDRFGRCSGDLCGVIAIGCAESREPCCDECCHYPLAAPAPTNTTGGVR